MDFSADRWLPRTCECRASRFTASDLPPSKRAATSGLKYANILYFSLILSSCSVEGKDLGVQSPHFSTCSCYSPTLFTPSSKGGLVLFDVSHSTHSRSSMRLFSLFLFSDNSDSPNCSWNTLLYLFYFFLISCESQ